MKPQLHLAALLLATSSYAQQEIAVRSFKNDGLLSFPGLQEGTTCSVQWTSSLTDPARTNWTELKSLLVTNFFMSTEWPMFFRIRGIPDTNLLSGLLAYWPLDGSAVDASGNGHNGTVLGAQLTQDRFGQPNHAYSFTGGTDRIDFGTNIVVGLPNSSFSAALWFRATKGYRLFGDYWGTTTSGDEIYAIHFDIDQPTGYIDGGSRNYPAWPLDYTGFDAPPDVRSNGWHQLAYVMDGASVCSLYLDGVLRTNLPYDASLNYNSNAHWGAGDALFHNDGGKAFAGAIDDIRIYNRALSSNEVWQLYWLPF